MGCGHCMRVESSDDEALTLDRAKPPSGGFAAGEVMGCNPPPVDPQQGLATLVASELTIIV